MAEDKVRVFVGDGPRGGEFVHVAADAGGHPPQEVSLKDPTVARGPVDAGLQPNPLPDMPMEQSRYRLDTVEGELTYLVVQPG